MLLSENTRKNQQWKCIIITWDGENSGFEYHAPPISIGNTRPIAIISSPSLEVTYYSDREILFDATGSFDVDKDKLSHRWKIDGVSYNSSSFSRFLTAGEHVIELAVEDDGESTSRKLMLTIKDPLKPDLFTQPSESYLTNLESDGRGQVGKDLTFTVFIWNKGEIEATATVNFYVETIEGTPIGQKKIRVPAKGFDTAFITWNPDQEGAFAIYAVVFGSTPEESDDTNNMAFRNITIGPKPLPKDGRSNDAAVVILGTISIGVFGAVIAGYEPWKFKFFAFLIPLYTKLNHENRMDNENRSKILGFIIGMEEGKRGSNGLPGVSYSTIKKKLNFSNGALAYHLSVLEREGDVRSEKVGKYRLYFPTKIQKPKTMFLERLTELQQKLVNEIRKHTEISQKGLVRSMDESQQVISYNLNRLERKGIVFLKKRGNRSYCCLNPEYVGNRGFM
jgi:predicted transcriptional regulator